MAIDKLNNLGLPEKYVFIRNNEDDSLIGLMYQGAKKEEVIVEPKYTECTAFKALGKIWIAYLTEDNYYLIRNKKGDIQTDIPIYDFVACNKALYCKIETNRGLELAQMDKELEVVKTFGLLDFADYYTNHGNRVIPNTRQTLDVKDSHDRTCRINMTDNTLEDVISFGSDARVKQIQNTDEDEIDNVVEEWKYELDITTGKVTVSDGAGGHLAYIADLAELDKFKQTLNNIFGQEAVENTEEVQVKRHKETRVKLVYDGVPAERAELINVVLKALPSNSTLSDVQNLIKYYSANENYMQCVCDFYSKDFKKLNNDYLVKVMTTDDNMLVAVKNKSGKVRIVVEDIDLGYTEAASDYELVKADIAEKDLDFETGKHIEKPAKYKNKPGSFYKRGLSVKAELTNSKKSDDIIGLNFMIFDKFTYGPLAVEKTTDLEVDGHKNRYNYNDKNIVLSTTTSDFLVILG